MNDLVENLNPYIENEKIGFKKDVWNDIPEFVRDNGMWNDNIIHFHLIKVHIFFFTMRIY
jgi:hypothetical protein